MDLDEESFLNELMAIRRETWETYPTGMSELLFSTNGEEEDRINACHDHQSNLLQEITPSLSEETMNFDCLSEICCPHKTRVSMDNKEICNEMDMRSQMDSSLIFRSISSSSGEMREHPKKGQGLPSKNLMAERRRRKRLNDRLSMLRSIVPKISKMDRTSILGDTIDYVKELLEKIEKLQEEIDISSDKLDLLSTFKESSNDTIVRNSTKFGVEIRSGGDTKIEICCPTNPSLLMSTLSSLESLGMEIEQCVVSSFSDFGMRASCIPDEQHRGMMSSEEIKQTLYRNAGYGGRPDH
ncbi:hypothetical protein LUZ60_014496 [Juncus effusus]|nr:hypothetical protein LUZ60_014496 [Juncus effusus]